MNTPKPRRALAVLVLLILALGGLMVWKTGGKPKPKLALDLSGGTTVTLTAQVPGGGAPKPEAMQQAIAIIRERVNGTGVAEADVTQQGSNNIVVAVPGQGQRHVVDLVGTTAELRFRQVLAEAPSGRPTAATPAPSPEPSAKARGKQGATPHPSAAASPASPRPTRGGRALAKALTASATPSPSTSAQAATANPSPPPASGAIDTSGIDKSVLAQFDRLDCRAKNGNSGIQDLPDKQIVSCDRAGTTKYILGPAEVLGTEVTKADAGIPQGVIGDQWQVNLTFNATGTKKFAAVTQRVVNLPPPRNEVAIVLDGRVVSAPRIDEPILGGNAQITGNFTQQEAQDLANVLRYGALPLKFQKSSIESVSATLGKDQLTGGLLAGAIGLALVVLYSFLYYRGLGIVSVLSLAIAAVLTYEAVVLLGEYMNFRLSLAGIAGLIVAIGITADSFIVYFERLRDEVREGRSLRSAVERGWQRARRTILVADAVSFLAAFVLWILAVGGVKGFAFTLGLTTIIDVVVVFLFTKPMVGFLARTRFYGGGHPLSGLEPRRLGARKAAPVTPTTPKEA